MAKSPGYLTISNWRYGLDARRSELTSNPGTLMRGIDCHINQGGEIEKRKSFVKTLITATPIGPLFGALSTPSGIMVFGSAPQPPGLPVNVVYRQLVAPILPGPTLPIMTGLVSATLFAGVDFVVAMFSLGGFGTDTIVFYNGKIVTDFKAGEVTVYDYQPFNQGIAADLVGLIDNTANYTATQNGNVVSVMGTNGANFSLTLAKTSTLGTLIGSQQNIGVPGTSATVPIATFTVYASAPGTGVTIAGVTSVKVFDTHTGILDTITLTAGTVGAVAPASSMASAVAANINANSGVTGFSALANGGQVTINAPAGSSLNTMAISIATQKSDNNDGVVCLMNCAFVFSFPTGSSITATLLQSEGSNTIWTGSVVMTSNSDLVTLAEAINASGGTLAPPFSLPVFALAVGNTLYMTTQTTSSSQTADDLTLTFTTVGDSSVNNSTPLSLTVQPSASIQMTSTTGQIVIGPNLFISPTVEVVTHGGTAPFTYAWTITNQAIFMSSLSGNRNSFTTNVIGVSSGNAKVGNISAQQVSAIATCLVTDANGITASINVNLSA